MISCKAPTQTHILLRAPRRFRHPAWTARQRDGPGLDNVVQAFLAEAGVDDPLRDDSACVEGGDIKVVNGARARRGPKTEGVWVGAMDEVYWKEFEVGVDGKNEEDEEDEMIWWGWDGKIAGFNDW
jgi:hypothetical protein